MKRNVGLSTYCPVRLFRPHSWPTGDLSGLRLWDIPCYDGSLPPGVSRLQSSQFPCDDDTNRSKTFHAMSGQSHPPLFIRFCHSSCILARIFSQEWHCRQCWMGEMEIAVWCLWGSVVLLKLIWSAKPHPLQHNSSTDIHRNISIQLVQY